MNKEYKQLEHFIEELKSSGKIRLAKSDFRFYSEAVNKSVLSKIKEIKIADNILEFYKQVDFIDIQWYVAEGAEIKFIDKDLDFVEGRLHVSNFTSLIENILNKNTQSIVDPFHTLNDNDYESLVDYFPFDLLHGDGAVCFKLENGIIKDELHLVYIGNNSFISPLKTGCAAYLSKGYENYVFHNWQKAVFMEDENCKNQMDYYVAQLKTSNI